MQKTLEQKLGDYFNKKLTSITNPEEEETKKQEGKRKSIFQEVKEKSVFAFNFKKKEPAQSQAANNERGQDQSFVSVLDPYSEDNKKINERALAKDIEDINRLKKIEEND